MRRKAHVLASPRVSRQATLQLPVLDFHYETDLNGPIDREAAQAFCAMYQKIMATEFIPEGIIRIDFDAQPQRFGSWDYGVSRQHPNTPDIEPLCLVVLQSVGAWTQCNVEQRDGQDVLVIASPHIAMYGKSNSHPEEYGQMLPVPALPPTAAQGYAMVYESDVEKVVISTASLLAAVKEYEGWSR